MFKKLRFKLAMHNGVILILFMLLFLTVIYLFMSKSLFMRVDRTLHNTAYWVEDLKQLPSEHFNRKDEETNKSLFKVKGVDRDRTPFEISIILRDANLNITATNVDDKEILSKMRKYAGVAMEGQSPSITNLEIPEGKIRVLSGFLNSNGKDGVVQVFVSIDREIAFLSGLISVLVGLGIFSIIILVTISWVLAGKALIPIKTSWQQQKDFIADASHELRTPLTVMQTSLEIVLGNREQTIGENYKWLQNIETETKLMSQLTNDLLLLAKIDAQQIQIDKKFVDLSSITQKVIGEFEPLFHNKDIKLIKKVQNNVSLLGDEFGIKRLMYILLDNAIKYTPPRGQVSLQLDANSDNVSITVTDTGIGISEQDKERIFERFYRVDKARSRETNGGTGLGLSIANWIVSEHHGIFKVNSEVGNGSCFTVLLPSNGSN